MHTEPLYLNLAILRLVDVCVRVQDGMEDFLATAGVEVVPRAENVLTWLRKRGVQTVLLSDYEEARTQVLMNRVNWGVGEDALAQHVVYDYRQYENPVARATQLAGLPDARTAFVLADRPELLSQGHWVETYFNIGVTNGCCSYYELARAPHHGLLEDVRELPNFLIEHLPESGRGERAPAGERVGLLPRLRLGRLLGAA